MAFKWTKASRAKLSRSQKALAHSLRAPVQERSSCPNALLPELRPNARLPEFIRSSASLRIRRRSSVWRIASIRPLKGGAHSEPTA